MRGHILFNGNIRIDEDFIYNFSELILKSNHVDESVRESKKSLLITAAWQGKEFNEGHLKDALHKIGIPSIVRGGFDVNVQNSGIYHFFNEFREKHPEHYELYHEKQEVIVETSDFYRHKNSNFVRILREQTRQIQSRVRETSLSEILSYSVEANQKILSSLRPIELLFHFACKDVQDTLKYIRSNDESMHSTCNQIEAYYRKRSRVDENPSYIKIRNEIRERILSSNSIFIFGGHMPVLLNRLKFFRLKDVFHEALNRGTNFYTVSAGSMVLVDKIIVFDDFSCDDSGDRVREFEFFEKGLGLIKSLTLFPHCMDRIQTDDADNLSYLANRFSSGPCVGLNQDSFMIFETVKNEVCGAVHDICTSIGRKDGVYVFDDSGNKTCKTYGESITV
jgi:hypothetical protein